MWNKLEMNQELVINGLDLLAFIFITVEIVVFMESVLSRNTLIVILAFAPLGALLALIFDVFWTIAGLPFIVALLLNGIIIILLAIPFKSDKFRSWFSPPDGKGALAIGVSLFVIARLFALFMAWQKLRGNPG